MFKFGSEVWFQVNKEKRKKLDPVAVPGIYLGIDKCTNGIRVLFNGKVKVTRDYVFTSKRESQGTMLANNTEKDATVSERQKYLYEENKEKKAAEKIETPDTERMETEQSIVSDEKEENEESDLEEYHSLLEENSDDTISEGEMEITGYRYDVGADVDEKNILYHPRERKQRILAVTINLNTKKALQDSEWKQAMYSEMESQKKMKLGV